MNWILGLIRKLQRHVLKPWYPFLLGFLAFIYPFVLLIPVDAIIMTSTLLAPKRWVAIFVSAAIGFASGVTAFAFLVELYGTQVIERITPGLVNSPIWNQSEIWMQKYGLFAVGGISLVPLTMHPLVALAGIHHLSMPLIGLSVFAGRFIKYGILAWLCAYIPSKVPLPKSAQNLIRPDEKTDTK